MARSKEELSEIISKNISTEFLEDNYLTLQNAINTYSLLKEYLFKCKGNGTKEGFKSLFSKFYGIQRFTSDDFKVKYFTALEELKGEKEFDVAKLAAERLNDGNKLQFSFVTKLVNILNDEEYPIYDSLVCRVFKLHTQTQGGNRIDSYCENYQIIISTYKHLIESNSKEIELFRDIFDSWGKKSMPDMRILDMIIWCLGASKNIQL